MIRRLLPLAGLVLLLRAAPASAASAACQAINGIAPVSRYTTKVIERADADIAHAQSFPAAGGGIPQAIAPNWAEHIGSAMIGLIDSQLRIVEQVRNLTERTACYRFDELLIECKIEEVRDAMNAALQANQLDTIWRLEQLAVWLNERYRHLIQGGRDNAYKDTTWGRREPFDPPAPTWCCMQDPFDGAPLACTELDDVTCLDAGGEPFQTVEGCVEYGCPDPGVEPPEDVLCPFDSDYLPPMLAGFGCDTSVMSLRAAQEALAAEYLALQSLEDEIADYKEEIQAILQLQQEIEALLGEGPGFVPPPGPPQPVQHRKIEGCAESACEFDIDTACERREDCRERDASGAITEDKGRCLFGKKLCSFDDSIECASDDDCTAQAAGFCQIGWPEELAAWEARGPFSIEKDQDKIMNAFRELREEQGRTREQSDELKVPDEFPPEKAALADRRRQAHFLEQMLRETARTVFKTWNREQGRAEAGVYAQGADAHMQVAEAFGPLRETVRNLVMLSGQRSGLRDFVIRYAWFARKSCMFRPCNKRLEQVLWIAETDACFPYADGSYLGDSCNSPRWKQCADAMKSRYPTWDFPVPAPTCPPS